MSSIEHSPAIGAAQAHTPRRLTLHLVDDGDAPRAVRMSRGHGGPELQASLDLRGQATAGVHSQRNTGNSVAFAKAPKAQPHLPRGAAFLSVAHPSRDEIDGAVERRSMLLLCSRPTDAHVAPFPESTLVPAAILQIVTSPAPTLPRASGVRALSPVWLDSHTVRPAVACVRVRNRWW